MAEKMKVSDFQEYQVWEADCPECGVTIELRDDPIGETGVECEHCETYFELED